MIQELHSDLDLRLIIWRLSRACGCLGSHKCKQYFIADDVRLVFLENCQYHVRIEDDPVVHWELTTFTQAQVIHEDFPKAVLTTACCRLELV